MPSPNQHARLSASSSARWLNCPPSAQLAAQFPDTGGSHAAAGTLAHAIAELKARKYFLEPMSIRTYNSRLKKLKEDPSYDKGMDAATDMYLDYLKDLAMGFSGAPFVALENRVDYSDYAPGGFGTADCILIGGGQLCVCDYKNGSGVPVEAENNSQLMLYALGALKVYGVIYGSSILDIHLAIIQPNAGGVKEWKLSRAELEEWGETVVKPAAALAWEGKGDFCPGPWCEKSFCPAKGQCTARARKLLEDKPPDKITLNAPVLPDTALLNEVELGSILTWGKQLEAFLKNLEDCAEKLLLSGTPVPGWKLVAGRTSRIWTGGHDAAFAQLKARGVNEALLWERNPVMPPKLEKALGKKVFTESAADLVETKPGAPTMKPESDKRPAYVPAQAAFQEVTP